jgi:hypothetical protein
LKVANLISKLVFIGAMLLTQSAFADCAKVGMMGGCLPGAGMVDVPTHMKSQIVNRVNTQKTATPANQGKASQVSANKKAGNANIAIASASQPVKQ